MKFIQLNNNLRMEFILFLYITREIIDSLSVLCYTYHSKKRIAAIYNESISRLYLSGVEYSTIKDYLESYELSKEQIDKVLEDDNLRETLQIPLFLTMYASLSEYDEVSTQGEILKLFFNERRRNISVYTMQERLINY